MKKNNHVVVIGSGPGGYAAAFRASDLGNSVTLIEKDHSLGGVCLNRGCIPSKTLIHLSNTINEADAISRAGVTFNKPKIDMKKIQLWKNRVIKKLGGGIKLLAKKRNVSVVNGCAKFLSDKSITVDTNNKEQIINFDYCIIASGSRPGTLSFLEIDHKNILDSTSVLSLDKVPSTMLVIGGGYIGLEMAGVYASLGTKVDVAEFLPRLLSGADKDLVDILKSSLDLKLNNIFLNTKVVSAENIKNNVKVLMESDGGQISNNYDKILVSVGRVPNTDNLMLGNAGVKVDNKNFILVDEYRRTNIHKLDNIMTKFPENKVATIKQLREFVETRGIMDKARLFISENVTKANNILSTLDGNPEMLQYFSDLIIRRKK